MGIFGQLLGTVGGAAGSAIGGPIGGAVGGMVGNTAGDMLGGGSMGESLMKNTLGAAGGALTSKMPQRNSYDPMASISGGNVAPPSILPVPTKSQFSLAPPPNFNVGGFLDQNTPILNTMGIKRMY